jgi:hypothetical protein
MPNSGSGDALVVSKWGHRRSLLELFKIRHKANFSRVCNVSAVQRRNVDVILLRCRAGDMTQCNMARGQAAMSDSIDALIVMRAIMPATEVSLRRRGKMYRPSSTLACERGMS